MRSFFAQQDHVHVFNFVLSSRYDPCLLQYVITLECWLKHCIVSLGLWTEI